MPSRVKRISPRFLSCSEAATTQAYWQALAAGSSVLVSENGEITEVFPDGTVKLVKKSAPFIATEKGKIIEIK